MEQKQEQASLLNSDQLISVAKWQRYVILMVILQIIANIWVSIQKESGSQPARSYEAAPSVLLALVLAVFCLVVVVLSIYGIYKLALSLGKPAPVLYALAMVLPCVSLIVLLVLNSQATQMLKSNGIDVGLMGASKEDIEQLINGNELLK